MPTENIKRKSLSAALLKTVPSRICSKYDKVYEDGPTTKRVVYIRKKQADNKHVSPLDTTSISPSICGFLKDCTEAASIDSNQQRMAGGKQPAQIVNVIPSLTICNVNSKPQPKKIEVNWTGCLQPSIVHVHIKNTPENPNWERFSKCIYKLDKKRPRKMNRGTQTLYRESSAQTLPYLPGVSNDKETLETLELFKLPKILKGDGPPGLYEVEILERARKRWAFEKAIKKEFECKMKEARTQLDRKKHFMKHKHVIEAFEWEHWLQREEAIQSYQMMRFDLVIRIFEKREREMHQSSNLRITMCCEQIAAKRDKALKKNEIEYGRQMRRMKIEHERKPRNWRKEKISDQLGDPSSEYYGPQMRYGVNPNRRHFQLSRKAFEMRMEDLEKRAVNMKNLECPFAKLKEWSKPKEQKPEIEQNFCTDTNLKKLYESLKGLREHSKKHKVIPKCLKEKVKLSEPIIFIENELTIEEFEYDIEEEVINEMEEEGVQVGASFSQNSLMEMFSQRDSNMLSLTELLDERRGEELENMLAEYEGTKIGWLMRFLSEEMGRLQEQRKLHFITMLAQKERWRREAAEAGLRQKENEMRRIYEDIFDETDKANVDVCEQYLDNIFGIDTREQADFEAANTITGLAKVIDADLQRWLCSFKLIQNPLNYDDLRCLLRDLVFPENLVDCLVRQYEATSVVDYVINDVLFPHIFTLLEPFDVVSPLTNDMVDRLIDNDLYLFSSECSSGCDCYDICECSPPELEAKAIMRKIIRQAVPGRRWRTPTERIADENANEIIDLVCNKIDVNKRCAFIPSSRRRRPTISKIPSQIDLFAPLTASNTGVEMARTSAETTAESSRIDTVTIVKYRKEKQARDSTTRSLSSRRYDTTKTTDTMVTSGSLLLDSKKLKSIQESSSDDFRPSLLRKIPSTLDIHDKKKALEAESDGDGESTDDEFEQLTRTHKHARRASQSFVRAICDDVVESLLPPHDFYEDAVEGVSTGTRQSVVGKTATRFMLDRITSRLTEDYEDTVSTGLETERTIKFEGYESIDYKTETEAGKTTSEHTMVLYEGQLKKILEVDDDECKCQMEIDYRNHIKELYESGKIKVIYKEPRSEEDEKVEMVESELLDVDLSEMAFEYITDATNVEQSVYHYISEGEGYEGEEEADIHTVGADDLAKAATGEAELAAAAEVEVTPTEQAPESVAEVTEVTGEQAPTETIEPTVEAVETETADQPVTEEIGVTVGSADQPTVADVSNANETAGVVLETQDETIPADTVEVVVTDDAAIAAEQPQERLAETAPAAETEGPAETEAPAETETPAEE